MIEVRHEDEVRVRRYLKQRFSHYRDGLTAGEPLDAVVDSLGLFDLVEWIEKDFAIRIPNEEFSPRRFATIDEILNTLNEFRRA